MQQRQWSAGMIGQPPKAQTYNGSFFPEGAQSSTALSRTVPRGHGSSQTLSGVGRSMIARPYNPGQLRAHEQLKFALDTVDEPSQLRRLNQALETNRFCNNNLTSSLEVAEGRAKELDRQFKGLSKMNEATPAPRQPLSQRRHYDLVVLGGGCVGLKAAVEAASMGKRVALVEPRDVITGAPTGAHSKCLREAAMECSKTWSDVEKVLRRSMARASDVAARQLEVFGVTFIQGEGTILDEKSIEVCKKGGSLLRLSFSALIIATGSKSNRFAPVDFDLPGVFDSDTIWGISYLPRRLVVQGAGIIGLEYAQIFAMMGAKVTIVETFDKVVPFLDASLRSACLETLSKSGVELFLSTPIKGVSAGPGHTAMAHEINVELDGQTLTCDTLLSACGRHGLSKSIGLENVEALGVRIGRGGFIQVDQNGWTGAGRIFAVGDVAGANLATLGQDQATRAVHKIFGGGAYEKEVAQKVMLSKPSAVWTIPEIAWVGLSEHDATKAGVNVGVAQVPYSHVVRCQVTGEEGFLKMVFDRDTGKVLGVHIFGSAGSDIVNYGAEIVHDGDTIYGVLQHVFPAVTYHMLYHHAATEAKMRLRGCRSIAAATVWRRIHGMMVRSLEAQGSHVSADDAFRRAFEKFDVGGTGVVTVDEMMHALNTCGLKVDDALAKEMMCEATDEDEATEVDYEQFLNALTQEQVQVKSTAKQFTTQMTVFSGMAQLGSGSHYNMIVIGGGCVGVKAAVEAAARGQRVAIIEPNTITGLPTGGHSKCLREAALSGATTWDEVALVLAKAAQSAQKRKARELRTFQVEVLQGRGLVLDAGRVEFLPVDEANSEVVELTHDMLLLATGSKSNRYPPVDFNEHGVFDSDTIWKISYIPQNLVVQGAGIIGLEYAQIFSRLGSKVIVVEPRDKVTPFLDVSLQEALIAFMAKSGIEIILNTMFKSVKAAAGHSAESPKLRIEVDGGRSLDCDCILSACGRHGCSQNIGLEGLISQGLKVNRGKFVEINQNGWTGVGNIYAAGDVAGGSLATSGMAQALKSVRTHFGSGLVHTEQEQLHKPFAVWTIPELAWVGITEEESKQRSIDSAVATAHYSQTVKGCVTGEEGFLKLVFDRKSAVILGVHILGELASDLINYGAELVNDQETIFDILLFVFPAVTYHALYQQAATEAKSQLQLQI